MDGHTLQLLEYERLLDLLAGFAKSEPGMDLCLALKPNLNPTQARKRWLLIDEAKEVLNLEGYPPLDALLDVTDLLDRLKVEGVVLRPLELRAILLVIETSRMVKNFLSSTSTPGLAEHSEHLPVMPDLEERFQRSISPEGEVLDTASPELARVRRELSGLRGAIQGKLSALMRTKEFSEALQDDIITRRGGRYVLPVQVGARRQVGGLVHDYSSSGATAYVEPFEMVEDNNRINYLRRKEKDEVLKVLKNLGAMVAVVRDEIAAAQSSLAFLDAVFAMAAFSRKQKALAPMDHPGPGVDLKEARHPLLVARQEEKDRAAVPLDLTLDPDRPVLIVSGVNAGGKTVALKTLGLLALMAQSGLHIPVREDSRIGFFDHILAAIGDEQDLGSDLSTFSAHVRRLTRLLKGATARSLVLLDELGTGTDPAEGAALALAVLDALKKRGSFVVTATHYHLLKVWGQSTPGVENAAVRTDPQGRPAYGLDYGTPGVSSGLAMAAKLGLDPELVAKAETYLDEGQKKTVELLRHLEEERALVASARERMDRLEEEMALAYARQSLADKKRAEEHGKTLETLKTKVEQAVRLAEREFRDIKNRFKEPRQSPRLNSEFKQARNKLEQVVDAPPRKGQPVTSVRIGDWVRVERLGKTGRVKAVNLPRRRVEVDLGGVTVQADLKDLTRPEGTPAKRERKQRMFFPTFSPAPRELNLLGLTVDEALPAVEKILDQAVLSGVKEFAIIHGVGTGKLRQAVRGYLETDNRVKGFRPLEPRAGGEGVTMVELLT